MVGAAGGAGPAVLICRIPKGMNISQNAVAAREQARRKTGEFGFKQHAEAAVSLADHRAGTDTPTGFIAANPVPGAQSVTREVKSVPGRGTVEVLHYTAGDGSKAIVLPDPGQPHSAHIYPAGRIAKNTPNTFIATDDPGKVAHRVLQEQDRSRVRSAAASAGIQTKGEEYELGSVHRDTRGNWEVHMRPTGSDPRSTEGTFMLTGHSGADPRAGVADTSKFRASYPVTSGEKADKRAAQVTGQEGESVQGLLDRLEEQYQKRLGQSGLVSKR